MVRLFYRLVTVVSCYFLKCERSRFIFLLEADLRMFSPDTFFPCAILGKRGERPWVSRIVVSFY